jgi:hypothetical protein
MRACLRRRFRLADVRVAVKVSSQRTFAVVEMDQLQVLQAHDALELLQNRARPSSLATS